MTIEEYIKQVIAEFKTAHYREVTGVKDLYFDIGIDAKPDGTLRVEHGSMNRIKFTLQVKRA